METQTLVAAPGPATPGFTIRPALPADSADLQGIYAHHVLHGTGTFDDTPPSVEAMQARLAEVTAAGWPWLVAEDATGVLGYCYLTRYRPHAAFRYCAEDAVYVRPDVRGQGVGKALVARLVEAATAAGFRQMIAVIGDAQNVGSIGVHASLGFQRAGMLRGVGWKFGRWIDTIYMIRALGEGDNADPD